MALNNVDKSEKYPFEYWFQFENLEDTCSHELTENLESQNSVFKLTDTQGDTAGLVTNPFLSLL